jgi:hypothetical protein
MYFKISLNFHGSLGFFSKPRKTLQTTENALPMLFFESGLVLTLTGVKFPLSKTLRPIRICFTLYRMAFLFPVTWSVLLSLVLPRWSCSRYNSTTASVTLFVSKGYMRNMPVSALFDALLLHLELHPLHLDIQVFLLHWTASILFLFI